MAKVEDDLAAFCARQAQRLGVYRDWGFMPEEARDEYVAWLTECVDRERISVIVGAATRREKLPTLFELSRIKDELFPPIQPVVPLASPDCPDCAGTGWMVVRIGANEGVIRCRCGGVARTPSPHDTIPALPRGAPLTADPGLIAIVERATAKLLPPPPKRPVTEEDVRAVLDARKKRDQPGEP